MRLEQQHAIITGGSSGIGLAIAQCLVEKGYHLTLIARTLERLVYAKKNLAQYRANHNSHIQAISGDVRDPVFLKEAMKEATSPYSSSDLYCSAGMAHPGHFTKLPNKIFEETMQINYFGTLNTVQAWVPCINPIYRSRLVLISSAAALMGIYGYSAYAPSKFALIGLAEVLAAELKEKNISVSIAFPPDTLTPQLDYENQHKPEQTRCISQSAGQMTALAVAKRIIKQSSKERFAINFNYQTMALYWLGNLIKPCLRKHFDRLIKQ